MAATRKLLRNRHLVTTGCTGGGTSDTGDRGGSEGGFQAASTAARTSSGKMSSSRRTSSSSGRTCQPFRAGEFTTATTAVGATGPGGDRPIGPADAAARRTRGTVSASGKTVVRFPVNMQAACALQAAWHKGKQQQDAEAEVEEDQGGAAGGSCRTARLSLSSTEDCSEAAAAVMHWPQSSSQFELQNVGMCANSQGLMFPVHVGPKTLESQGSGVDTRAAMV
jgi:hypothetical protein